MADDTGRTLTSVGQVDVGDRMTVYVKDGSLQAQVMEKKRVDR